MAPPPQAPQYQQPYQQPAAPPPPPPQYQQPYQQPGAPPPPPPQYQQPYQQPGAPPPGYQQAPPSAGGLTDNVAAALCYLCGAITGIIFLVLEPYKWNKLIRFHAFQSIFLNVVLIVVWIVLSILFSIMLSILPFGVWRLLSLINWVVWLAFMAVWILLMFKAYQNQKFVIPVIGQLAEKQA